MNEGPAWCGASYLLLLAVWRLRLGVVTLLEGLDNIIDVLFSKGGDTLFRGSVATEYYKVDSP